MGSQSTVSLGALKPQSTWGEYNNLAFVIQQALSKLQTATLVRVDACSNAGGIEPVGSVDVTPLINQIDGAGNPTPHVTVYGLPYLRIQGGANAVVIDPQPGDIGIAVFASRDISKAKSAKGQANPGSYRQYDFADGMYLGGVLNAEPTQYLRFTADGITISSPETITLLGATIKAGSSPVPVVAQPFLTWVQNTLIPTLVTHGITLPTPPPANSLTTTFEAT